MSGDRRDQNSGRVEVTSRSRWLERLISWSVRSFPLVLGLAAAVECKFARMSKWYCVQIQKGNENGILKEEGEGGRGGGRKLVS